MMLTRERYQRKLMSDNATAVYGINNMGSNDSDLCNQISFDILPWVEKCNIWITAAYRKVWNGC